MLGINFVFRHNNHLVILKEYQSLFSLLLFLRHDRIPSFLRYRPPPGKWHWLQERKGNSKERNGVRKEMKGQETGKRKGRHSKKEGKGKERKGKERKGKERKGKGRERKGNERQWKERKGKDRKERKGKERKEKERKGEEGKGKEIEGKERKSIEVRNSNKSRRRKGGFWEHEIIVWNVGGHFVNDKHSVIIMKLLLWWW